MHVNSSSGMRQNLAEFVVFNVGPLFSMWGPKMLDLQAHLAPKFIPVGALNFV